jgi:hypothetical protein
MHFKRSLLLSVALCSFLPLSQTRADNPVIFEILANFAYPGANFTNVYGINDNGDLAGSFTDNSGAARGFVRYHDGRFSMPIEAPDGIGYTLVTGVNDSRMLCGYYRKSGLYSHGFVLSGNVFTDFVVAGATDTFVQGMNDPGNFCGSSYSPAQAFVSIAGDVTSFTVPGALTTNAAGINNLNQCAGSYNTGNQSHGFLRQAGGALKYPVDVPGAFSTFLNGINDQGSMVGEADGTSGLHAVFFQSVNKLALFDYPGASFTSFTGINNRDLICGIYQTATNMTNRAFLVRVRPAAQD